MIATVLAFVYVTNIAKTLYTVVPANNHTLNTIFQCGTACTLNSDCGGFIWDKAKGDGCQFVVYGKVAGATQSPAKEAYRIRDQRNMMVFELSNHTRPMTPDSASNDCNGIGAKLLDFPMTNKAVALVSMTRYLYQPLDVQRKSENPDVYKNMAGDIVDVDGFGIEWYSGYPLRGNKIAMFISDGSVIYDHGLYFTHAPHSEKDLSIFCMI